MTFQDFIQHGLILFIVNCRAITIRQGNGQPVDFVFDSFIIRHSKTTTIFRDISRFSLEKTTKIGGEKGRLN